MIAIAIEDIPAGTPLVWCYGPGCASLVFGSQILLRRAEMRNYFERGLRVLVAEAEKRLRYNINDLTEQTVFPHSLQLSALEARLIYPIETPAALLDLHFSGIVPASLWNWLLDESNSKFANTFVRAHSFHCGIIRCLIRRIEVYELKMEAHPAIRQAVADFVMGSIGNLSVMQILKLLSLVGNDVVSISDISAYLIRRANELQTYDWTKDSDAPLSDEMRRQDMLYCMLKVFKTAQIPKKDVLIILKQQYQEMFHQHKSHDFEELQQLDWIIKKIEGAGWDSSKSTSKKAGPH